MNSKAILSVTSVMLLLLLIIMIFFMFMPWILSIDSEYRVNIEKDSFDVSIVEFKNNVLTLKTSYSMLVTNLEIYNESYSCEINNTNVDEGTSSIDISSCSLVRGNIYDISVLTTDTFNKKIMVYR